jgi:hypothetical protein
MEQEYSALDRELQKLQSQGNYEKIIKILEALLKEQKELKIPFDHTQK